jgi:hypothetical protein
MQCPLKTDERSDADELSWSKRAESVRKDIECTFGILKGRFKILKLPMFYHSSKNAHTGKERVDNVFFTCCMLHNMLLLHDKLMDWEAGVDWSRADGLWDQGTPFDYLPEFDFSVASENLLAMPAVPDEGVEVEEGWGELRAKLVAHFAHPVARAKMSWNTLKMRFEQHGVE